jgi:hypothetical protein
LLEGISAEPEVWLILKSSFPPLAQFLSDLFFVFGWASIAQRHGINSNRDQADGYVSATGAGLNNPQ